MRKKIVAGNWKMNKTLVESQALITEIRGIVRDENTNNAEVIICPTFLALTSASKLLDGSTVKLGAQNCHFEESGAYTGELSASMLKSVGVSHVIIGHSERRQYFYETNELLAKKTTAAVTQGLTVLFCVGETLQEREYGSHFDIIKSQISEGLFHLNAKDMSLVVVAYEPVWAIGTGLTASSEQAEEVHAFIRSLLTEKFGETISEEVSILYGGSVKPDNAAELFSKKNIDGGLIGGAALKARDFFDIIKAIK
jgi:triosephosphate isomerase